MFRNKDYILEIWKEKNFSKAAKNLYISQPSLSATVKRTEEQLNALIFDRSTNPISLTEIGKRYIECANEIKNIEDSFSEYINDSLNIHKGSIKVGGTSLFSSYILPDMIAAFNAKYPQIEFRLCEDNTKNLIEMLMNGELDVMIDNTVILNENIAAHPYAAECLLLAVPGRLAINDALVQYSLSFSDIKEDRHREPDCPTVSLTHFKDEAFIFLKQENDTGKKARQLCKKHGFSPTVRLLPDQQMTAYNIACSGMGICFVSDTLIRHLHAPQDMLYYKLNDPEINRNIYFYVKNNRYISSACRLFIDANLPMG